ncbi:MAG: MFS transporter [Gammaproteobacteria bacterium]
MTNGSNSGGTAANAGRTASTRHGMILLLAAVMPPMAIISLVPVIPLLMKEFARLEGFQFLVPIAVTIPALCVALFSPVAGWLSDRAGRKNLLVFALILYAAIGVAPFFLTELKQIIGARIVLGLAEAVIMTIATALIGDYFQGKERERWVARQIATVSLSAIFLIAVGGILGEALGSRGPFLLYVLAIPVAIAVALILFEPEHTSKSESGGDTKLPLGKILPLLLTTLFVGIIFYTIIVKLGEVLGLSADVSPGQIGAIGAAANVGVAVGSFLFSRFKGFSGPMLVLIGLILSGAGYLGSGLSGSLAMTSIAVVIACLGFGILLPTMLTWILQVLPENVRGRGTGLWTGVFFFGQFFAPLLAVALQSKLGGLQMVLLLFAGLCAVGVLISAVKLKGAESLLTK